MTFGHGLEKDDREDPSALRRRRPWEVVRRILGVLFFGIGMGFLAHYLLRIVRAPEASGLFPDAGRALLAIGLTALGLCGMALTWARLVRRSASVPVHHLVWIWMQSALVKYVPGGFWHVAGRLALAREAGMDPVLAGRSMLYEAGLQVGAATLLASVAFATDVAAVPIISPSLRIPLILVVAAGSIGGAYLSGQLLWKNAEEGRDSSGRPQTTAFIGDFLGYGLSWLLIAAGFATFAFAGRSTLIDMPGVTVGSFLAAWVAGFIVVFAPGGLGLREGALWALLSPYTGADAALALAAGGRVIWVGGEVVAILGGMLLSRFASRASIHS